MTTNRHRASILVSTMLAAAALASACAESVPPQPASTAAEPAIVELATVIEQPLNVTMEMPGELEAYEMVDMHPRVTGYVKTVRVDRGSRVRAGELLAVLDAPELAAQRAEAQSKLQGAEAQLAAARARAAGAAGTFEKLKAASATPGVVAGNDLIVAQKNVEADRSQVVAAEQTVEAARQSVKAVTELEGYLRITAPFAGVVTERNVHPGALVGPAGMGGASPLFRLAQATRLRLTVPVPEAYTARLKQGTAVSFTVRAYPDEKFVGTIARIATTVDTRTRTMAVELDVNNKDGRLAPGSFSQVHWPIQRSGPSLLVPASSIATTTDRVFVVRVVDGRAEWVDVKPGLSSGALMEVFGTLKAGDRVAVRGTDELRPGTGVRAREAKPST